MTSSVSRIVTVARDGVYIGLGTNVGDRRANLEAAIARIATVIKVVRRSSIYQTEPVGFKDQPDFWNMVIECSTDLPARQLMQELLRIEEEMGRVRTFKNAPRIIDLDILQYDDVRINEPDLQIPHPRMHERAFVTVPMQELNGTAVDLPPGIEKVE
ncbi:MAG TPA: 2-amino-4-hydroxy-6-hydroxymethyldihydropteridine diphosphokinase [Longimicrobiales bacterium]|nr:2-amino-4-hydroxy-6-hydroxymethyldihydropteridine diphosphokinase [Longimicrobiales bacterium]